jgi:hypothetical protein
MVGTGDRDRTPLIRARCQRPDRDPDFGRRSTLSGGNSGRRATNVATSRRSSLARSPGESNGDSSGMGAPGTGSRRRWGITLVAVAQTPGVSTCERFGRSWQRLLSPLLAPYAEMRGCANRTQATNNTAVAPNQPVLASWEFNNVLGHDPIRVISELWSGIDVLLRITDDQADVVCFAFNAKTSCCNSCSTVSATSCPDIRLVG